MYNETFKQTLQYRMRGCNKNNIIKKSENFQAFLLQKLPYNAQQAYLIIDAMHCGKLLTGVMYQQKLFAVIAPSFIIKHPFIFPEILN